MMALMADVGDIHDYEFWDPGCVATLTELMTEAVMVTDITVFQEPIKEPGCSEAIMVELMAKLRTEANLVTEQEMVKEDNYQETVRESSYIPWQAVKMDNNIARLFMKEDFK